MLRSIPKTISPELMKVMMEMGHSDRLVIADANFPAAAHAKRLIRADGMEIPELLDAILRFFPLDGFVKDPVSLMRPLDTEPTPEIWATYEKLIREHDVEGAFTEFSLIGRLAFYEETESAYAVVATGTTARYANIVLQKGVI